MIVALVHHTSVRTLILGVTSSGRLVEHDRSAPEVIAAPDGPLLGAQLSDVIAEPALPGSVLAGVLEAISAGREATAVLAVRTRRGHPVDAVVSVQPMRSSESKVVALIMLRVPPPSEEQFMDPAVIRYALLSDAFRHIGTTLDLDQMARGLVNILVPHFCNAAGLLVLESLVTADEPTPRTEGDQLLRRLAFAGDPGGPAWEAMFPLGETVRHAPGSPQALCLQTGKPMRESDVSIGHSFTRSPMHGPAAHLLDRASMLVLPLISGDSVLGEIVCLRRSGLRAFDSYDIEIGMEFASRAAIFTENARRYNRERTTAITLQRSLLPTGLTVPSSVQVAHRYLPGSHLVEVGGDWYESLRLPGARAALVVGDVAGHGVGAAVTMGRLRTAIQTLAMLELTPSESLQQLDELMHVIGVREPHFATCVYATYDAVNGTCELASAGHLPPLLVSPDGTGRYLDLPAAPPLGVGEGPIRSTAFTVEDGSLLVLYTDGLVESRTADIDAGLERLRAAFEAGVADRTVDELCMAALASAYAEEQRDDIAVLIARLHRIDPGQHVSWDLPGEVTTAGRARALVGEPLGRWGLEGMLPLTQLLVSELVTNAIRYTSGPVMVRLINEGTLVCEVYDSSPALPRLRHAARDDECGRGLEIVSQMSDRWGARRTPSGKVVWCEQKLPNR
jgi:serine phosphatase RsbU (regulator of sigma subunit)